MLAAVGGAVAARVLLAAGRRVPAGRPVLLVRTTRTNHRGRPVSLLAGPVLAVAAGVTASAGAHRTGLGRSALLVVLVAGFAGGYDDVAGARPVQRADKGFCGHLGALRQGRISAGLVKAAAIGTAGLLAARPVASGRVDTLVTGGVIAGTANLVNLLDLRPGRALKGALLLGLPLVPGPAGAMLAGPMGAAAALLPDDLAERVMLGDTGANAIGGLVGLALAATTNRVGRAVLLVALVALTAASERISFTGVIERTRVLRTIDALGRRQPAASP